MQKYNFKNIKLLKYKKIIENNYPNLDQKLFLAASDSFQSECSF